MTGHMARSTSPGCLLPAALLLWSLALLAMTLPTLCGASSHRTHPSPRRRSAASPSGEDGAADASSTGRLTQRFAHLRPVPEDSDDSDDEADLSADHHSPGGGGGITSSGGGGGSGGRNQHRGSGGRRRSQGRSSPTTSTTSGRNRNKNRNHRGYQEYPYGGGGFNSSNTYDHHRGSFDDGGDGSDDDDDDDGGVPEAGGGCPRCEMHEEYKRLRLEAIKAEILSRLNLQEAPKMSNKTLPQNPTFSSLIDRFEMSGDAPYETDDTSSAYTESDSYHVKPLDILLLASKPPANKTLNESNLCYFSLNREVTDAVKIRAQMGIYIKQSRAHIARRTLIIIHKLERRARDGAIIKRKIYQIPMSLDRQSTGRWYRWSLDEIVRGWASNPDSNLGLLIDAFDFDGTPLAIVQAQDELNEPFIPYLEVQVKGNSRPKRTLQAPECTANDQEKNCCRYPLIVDFVAMKWDWIIAPKQYKAYYCYGKCPFAYYRPYPHTHVVSQTRLSDFTPCCTASELKQLLLFYRNQEQAIIYGRIPGMIVESCSCI